eukprot:SAG11_NODE_3558_length_2374_cov_2.450549_2_plen_67_part_00
MALGYGISTLHCMTVSLAQGGLGIGIALGPGRYEELATAAGFECFALLGDNGLNNFYQLGGPTAGL